MTRDPKVSFMYSAAFMCNDNYQSTADMFNNPIILNDHKYGAYYMDFIYKKRVMNKMINLNIKEERNDIYEKIQSTSKTIKGYYTLKSIGKKNFFFDMAKYNEYFFNITKNKPYKVKMGAYIDYLKSIYDDKRFVEYKHKTVYIEIDSWINVPFQKLKTITFDNPIMIFYILMKRDIEKFKELGNIDFILYDKQGHHLRLNPSLCDSKSHPIFKKELIKLSSHLSVLDKEGFEETEEKRQEVYNDVLNSVYDYFRFTGKEESITPSEGGDHDAQSPDISEELSTSVKERIVKELENTDLTGNDPKKVALEIQNNIFKDSLVVKNFYDEVKLEKMGKTKSSTKRDEELRAKQEKLMLEGKSVKDIMDIQANSTLLEVNDVSSKISSTNQNVSKVRYPSFEKAYNEKLYKKDILDIVSFLNNKSIPVFIRDVKVEDTSTEMSLKETYTFDLEDGNRVRHKLKFDVPKFIDHKFLYLNGNKKILIKQLFLKPIVKTRPDTVQICTNYNKVFIFRHGDKMSSKMERMKKAISTTGSGISFKIGDNSSINSSYKTVLEYDVLAKDYATIKIKNHTFIFSQDVIRDMLKERKITLKDNELCIGFISDDKKTPILVNTETQTMWGESSMDIVDYMLSLNNNALVKEYDDAKVGKKYMYSRAKIMEKFIPLVILLGFCEGLSTVLKKSEVKYFFTDKRPTLNDNQSSVQFADGYLVYDKFPIKNSLLLNGLSEVPTKAFNYSDFDTKDTYVTLFDTMFNSRIIANALKNNYDFLIDPITLDILKDLNYPTDYVSLMLYANELLSDNAYMRENNMNLYRVRSNEMVNAYLYKAISRAYLDYELTSHNANPMKISIPQDKILKDLLLSQNVEDYSTLDLGRSIVLCYEKSL
jgi:hypothetical protein